MNAEQALKIAQRYLKSAGHPFFRARSSKKLPKEPTYEVIADVGVLKYEWMRVIISDSGEVVKHETIESD